MSVGRDLVKAALLSVCLFFAGVLVSGGVWLFENSHQQHFMEVRFDREVERLRVAIQNRLAIYNGLTAMVASVMQSYETVPLENWRLMVEGLNLPENYPAVTKLAFVRYVRMPHQLGVDETHMEHVPGLEAMGDHLGHFMVTHVEPIEENADLFGRNLRNDPTRYEALIKARDTGKPIMSGRFKAEEHSVTDLMMFKPVFQSGVPIKTQSERVAAIEGWVGVGFDVDRLFSTIIGRLEPLIHFHIFSQTDLKQDVHIYDRGGEEHSHGHAEKSAFSKEISFNVANQVWRVRASTLHEFEHAYGSEVPTLFALGGVLFSLVFSIATYLMLVGRARARDLAVQMTNEARKNFERAEELFTTLQDAIESISEGFVLWDENDRLVMCNQRYREMYSVIADAIQPGVPFEELAQASIEMGQHPVDIEKREDWIKERIKRHRQSKGAYEQRMTDGRWVMVSERRTASGGIVGTRADISELKETVEALRESEGRFRVIAETVPVGVVMADLLNGQIVYANTFASKILTQNDSTDLFGHKLTEALVYDGDWNSLRDRFEHEGPGGQLEIRLQSDDGHDRWFLIANEEMDYRGNRVLLLAIHDISVEKATQVQLVQTSKLATLGEMATGVAHEINQPLAVIQMAADGVLKYMRKNNLGDHEFLERKLKRISEQVDRAKAITDHMRTFGRKAPDTSEMISVYDVLTSSLDLVSEQMKAHSIEVDFRKYREDVIVKANAIKLEQVMLNLISNARDALKTATLDGNQKRISIEYGIDPRGLNAYINVRDNGGGIPEAILSRIFEPFFTTKDIGSGTGLGLSISYGILNEMGGSISARNIAQGAEFTIILPLANVKHDIGSQAVGESM